MEKIVVVVLFYLVTVAAGLPTEQVPASLRCVPGQAFVHDDGCNSCFCTSSALKKDAGCTRMSCLPVTVAVRNERSLDNASSETCVPGTSFPHSDKCNTCVCPASGLKSQAACTAMACVNLTHDGHVHHSSESSESSEHHRTTRDSSTTCEPGTSFMDSDNCNSCFCPPSGLKSEAGCTLKLCFNRTNPVFVHDSSQSSDSSDHRTKRDTHSSSKSSDESCEEGEKWTAADGCNQCVCPASGKASEAMCTKIGCIRPPLNYPAISDSSEDSDASEVVRPKRQHNSSSESHESHEGEHHHA